MSGVTVHTFTEPSVETVTIPLLIPLLSLPSAHPVAELPTVHTAESAIMPTNEPHTIPGTMPAARPAKMPCAHPTAQAVNHSNLWPAGQLSVQPAVQASAQAASQNIIQPFSLLVARSGAQTLFHPPFSPLVAQLLSPHPIPTQSALFVLLLSALFMAKICPQFSPQFSVSLIHQLFSSLLNVLLCPQFRWPPSTPRNPLTNPSLASPSGLTAKPCEIRMVKPFTQSATVGSGKPNTVHDAQPRLNEATNRLTNCAVAKPFRRANVASVTLLKRPVVSWSWLQLDIFMLRVLAEIMNLVEAIEGSSTRPIKAPSKRALLPALIIKGKSLERNAGDEGFIEHECNSDRVRELLTEFRSKVCTCLKWETGLTGQSHEREAWCKSFGEDWSQAK